MRIFSVADIEGRSLESTSLDTRDGSEATDSRLLSVAAIEGRRDDGRSREKPGRSREYVPG